MSNLYNQNIGINYKGILNLDTTINTPLDATLRAVTDGMGTASLLQLSTEAVGLSRTVNLSAGATTLRLFNVAYTINNSGVQTGTLTGLFLNATETALNGITHNLLDLQVGGVSKFSVSNAGAVLANGLNGIGFFSSTLLRAASNGFLLITNATGNDFNRIQLGGTTSSFPSLQRNTNSISFRLADDSGYCNARLKQLRFENASVINDINDGTITLSNNAQNDFNRLQLGGTTNAFPSIKRNGAAIDFRLADDSGFCAVNTGVAIIKGSGATSATTSLLVQNSAGNTALNITDDLVTTTGGTQLNIASGSIAGAFGISNVGNTVTLGTTQNHDIVFNGFYSSRAPAGYRSSFQESATSTAVASALVTITSTTKGFLMPRMTQAQILLILTPANGLMVYNTDINTPCFYDGGAARWERCSHSVM